ncbi:hypothetical protein XA68_16987 [Ophiocordyceps unilateralis]|uniref:HIT domain-containing protein n=1 Tax=Ophiocordyceps unilateralis TaxID=268505 RepID=A0A2A9PK08_OPHUN|nr:hypothetical protein XA68_16987 [Ophiocordyceps unilateralis]
MSSTTAAAPRFKLDRVLNQDQAGRRINLIGTIDDAPAILLVERAPFPADDQAYLAALPRNLTAVTGLGANDVYSWGLARLSHDDEEDHGRHPDVKLNLIHPCTQTHVDKYSKQPVRSVTESPTLYRQVVRPFMQRRREGGRLNWVYNILDGRTEVDDVIFRTPLGEAGDQGFVLLPDLNWDRATIEALHLLALVERRDIWSLRDLRKKHIHWLEHMRSSLVAATVSKYPSVDDDQLKLYLHYQPTYYHLHIHIVHVALEAGPSQATGKAATTRPAWTPYP